MRKMIDLFNKFWEKRSRDIIVGCIGRIESFDKVKMRADVQPLLEFGANKTKFAVIGDVPVQFLHAGGFFIRPDYKKGDLVWVSYSTFSIEAGLNNIFDDVSTGAFSRESASISHGLAPEKWKAPELFNKDGLLIGRKDVFLQIDKDINILGNVNIEGNVNIKGNMGLDGAMDASDNVKVKGNIVSDGDIDSKGAVIATEVKAKGEVSAMNAMVKLSTHMHATAALGSPSPPTPGT